MNGIIYIAAACIIDPHNRLLVVRKQGSDIFMQPGGKIEAGEEPTQALVRELKEELQVDIPSNLLQWVGCFEAPAANEPGYWVKAELFKITLSKGFELNVAAEIAEARWITEKELASITIAPLMYSYVIPLWLG